MARQRIPVRRRAYDHPKDYNSYEAAAIRLYAARFFGSITNYVLRRRPDRRRAGKTPWKSHESARRPAQNPRRRPRVVPSQPDHLRFHAICGLLELTLHES